MKFITWKHLDGLRTLSRSCRASWTHVDKSNKSNKKSGWRFLFSEVSVFRRATVLKCHRAFTRHESRYSSTNVQMVWSSCVSADLYGITGWYVQIKHIQPFSLCWFFLSFGISFISERQSLVQVSLTQKLLLSHESHQLTGWSVLLKPRSEAEVNQSSVHETIDTMWICCWWC